MSTLPELPELPEFVSMDWEPIAVEFPREVAPSDFILAIRDGIEPKEEPA
jgi:hypothetical protein